MPWDSVAPSAATLAPNHAAPKAPAPKPSTCRRESCVIARGSSRSFTDPGGLVGVEPPDRRESRQAVFRQFRRVAEAIPARGADFRIIPLRHDVVIPQQHAIERFGRRNQIVAVLGKDYPLDQFVDRRILDADDVARAGLVSGLRAPIFALLVARRQGFRP